MTFRQGRPPSGLKPATFRESPISICEPVFCFGYTERGLQYRDGSVSNDPGDLGWIGSRFGQIIHSANLEEGFSGGPLFDQEGKIAGINIAENGLANNYSLEGSLSYELLRRMLNSRGEISGHYRVERAYTGILFGYQAKKNANKSLINNYERDRPIILDTITGSPAAGNTKLHSFFGDYLISINGKEVHTLQEVLRIIELSSPGAKLNLGLSNNPIGPPTDRVPVFTRLLKESDLERISDHFFEHYFEEANLSPGESPVLAWNTDQRPDESDHVEIFQGRPSTSDARALMNFHAGSQGPDYENRRERPVYTISSKRELGIVIRLSTLLGAVDLFGGSNQVVYRIHFDYDFVPGEITHLFYY